MCFAYLIPAGAKNRENKINSTVEKAPKYKKGLKILFVFIPEVIRTMVSFSLAKLIRTNVVAINTDKGSIWVKTFGITLNVSFKKVNISAPLRIASSSILRIWINQAKESIPRQTKPREIISFFIIYLSILAILVRLYTKR